MRWSSGGHQVGVLSQEWEHVAHAKGGDPSPEEQPDAKLEDAA